MIEDRLGNVWKVLGDGFAESFFEAAPRCVTIHAIGESRMMAGNEVGYEPAELRDILIGELCTGGGVVHFTGEIVAV